MPKAAVDFPFPLPVLTTTSEGSRRNSALIGESVGGVVGVADVSVVSGTRPVKQVLDSTLREPDSRSAT